MNTHLLKTIKQTSVLLVAHYATFAYQDLLYRYFTNNNARLVAKINFPLPELPLLKRIEQTNKEHGKRENVTIVPSLVHPVRLSYAVHVLQLLWIILTGRYRYDLVIAEDSLLACTSLILRLFGKVKTVIFYSHGIDFTRFSSVLENRLYQELDRFAARHSDFNWSLSQNMFPIRKRQGISKDRLFWVPSSLPIDILPRKQYVANHSLIFLGVINDKNGVGILPDIIMEVQKKVPDVRLDVMGDGDMKAELKDRINALGLTKHIRMLGNLEFGQFKNKMTNYRVGLVTYKYSEVNLIPTSDSMKMRVYLAAGLPVVLTRGFVFSDEVVSNTLGFAVDYDAKKFAQRIITLLTNDSLSRQLRKNALSYSKSMDLTSIYNRTFATIFAQQSRTV